MHQIHQKKLVSVTINTNIIHSKVSNSVYLLRFHGLTVAPITMQFDLEML